MDKITTFKDMKLSENTLKALDNMRFTKPTKVQIKTIPICLKERDVVVQAKTGSGKTLAFLIPLIEQLTQQKCNISFGIQAVILVPTAELAIQTVNVLSKLVKFYPNITYLSVVGGKSHTGKKQEWEKINDANIIISTPGRLLEHMQNNTNADFSNIRMLIIDETDYMLEETFIEEMEAILKYLPPSRTNWLFSATLTSIVKELGRLALRNPVNIGMDDNSVTLPKNLTQTFMKITLPEKLQALWNLLDAQHKANTIVFFSTQKQVLFTHRLFSMLKPSYKLVQLRSNMRLDKRSNAIEELLSSKGGIVLFGTDIVSRGLDFPNVSLVIHYDLPRDFDYYVHRAGRTARFDSRGTSLLMVMPSEMGFMSFLKDKGLILKKISNNVLKTHKMSIAERASIQYTLNVELFNIAKGAFLSYIRDYTNRPSQICGDNEGRKIFNVQMLPVKLFAKSLGFKSIPEELSTMQPTITSIEVNDRPFLTVKKNIVVNPKGKLSLSMMDDDVEDSNEMETEMEEEECENVAPAFDFEREFLKLQSSSKSDKKYFRDVIKPKYQTKKRKITKEEGDSEMEVDDSD